MLIEWQLSHKCLEYSATILQMEKRVNEVIEGRNNELIWLLQHEHVYTIGTDKTENNKIEDIIHGVPVICSGRGGKYTYHGPGQLIIYPILNLKKRNMCDIKKVVWSLEEVIIRTFAQLNLHSYRREGSPGVWISEGKFIKKIAALGIRVRKWIMFHGLAINVCPDLQYYDYISPCGFSSMEVTALKNQGFNVGIVDVCNIFKEEFRAIFDTIN